MFVGSNRRRRAFLATVVTATVALLHNSGVAAQEVVDCNEFQSSITLRESSPRITFAFTVTTPDSDTNVELTPEQVAAGGVYRGRLTHEGEAWVSIGRSPNGKMINSDAIICLPDSGEVLKYDLASYDISGIQPLPETQQTLTNTSLSVENDVTVCTFTKLLNEEGELSTNANGPNMFIWAVGYSNQLFVHQYRGSIVIPFQACTSKGVDTISLKSYENYWKAHGILLALAWGLCAPVAIAASLARSVIKCGEAGLWMQIHKWMNIACAILTIAGFGVAVAVYGKIGLPHFQGTHERVGLAIFVVVMFQVVNGMARPHLPKAAVPKTSIETTGHNSTEHCTEHGENDFQSEQQSEHQHPPEKKSTKRTGWEALHKLVGAALLGMGMYNGYSGPKLYAALGHTESASADAWILAWWIWLGALLGAAVIVKIISAVRK